MSETQMITINIAKRPWWVWLIGVIDLLLVVFFAQNGFASFGEGQPRAAYMALGVALILAVGYYAFWRRSTLK